MELVIIESPYAGDLERNAKYLRACIRDCIARGESPYASHRMLTDALDDSDPEERELGIELGFAFRRAASKTAVYVDLGISDGMIGGIADAGKLSGKGHELEIRRLGEDWEDRPLLWIPDGCEMVPWDPEAVIGPGWFHCELGVSPRATRFEGKPMRYSIGIAHLYGKRYCYARPVKQS